MGTPGMGTPLTPSSEGQDTPSSFSGSPREGGASGPTRSERMGIVRALPAMLSASGFKLLAMTGTILPVGARCSSTLQQWLKAGGGEGATVHNLIPSHSASARTRMYEPCPC
jgi:hypothetical protein